MLRTHPPPPPGEDARPSPSVPPLPPTSETASASSDVSHTPPPHHSEHHRPYSSQDTAASAADRQPSASSSSSSWYHTSPVDAHERLPPLQSNTRVSRTDSLAASDSSGASASPLSRKPVSSTVSPLTTYSTAASPAVSQEQQFQKPDAGFSRNFLVDSPTLYEFPHKPAGTSTAAFSAAVPAIHGVQSASSSVHSQDLHAPSANPAVRTAESPSRNIPSDNPAAPQTARRDLLSQYEERTHNTAPLTSQDTRNHKSLAVAINTDNINSNGGAMSASGRKPSPAHLHLGQASNNNFQATTSASSLTATAAHANQQRPNNAYTDKPLPKSPISASFVWGGQTSPTVTDFSDNGYSPLPSPFFSQEPKSATDDSPVSLGTPQSATLQAQNILPSPAHPLGHCEREPQTPSTPAPAESLQIDEMEEELKAISAELAASIRREMDLDDLVERLQAQINNPHAPGKRTSDYFSDSGISSAKFSDYDQAKEEIEQIQRRAEQDVAKVRLELTTKLQDERLKRRQLDQQIKELSAKAAQVDLAKIQSVDASGRLKELENTCEQLRRQLAEERQAKDNFEDLLTALRGELQSAANERDNLRDEVVPQLRARVEGLEAQAAENAKLTYEATKMQQELQKLKEENISRGLNGVSSFKLQPPPSAPKPAAKGQVETREQIAERLKDVEAQRDALHNALKSLLERQEFQNRENEKKIRALEQERDRLLAAEPQKASYERQIADLRVEINVLRKRAEEAIDRRCRVEQTVAGLKSDLERAKEEIAMLRRLLSEHDILAPASVSGFGTTASINFAVSGSTSSASLEKAHKELQVAYQESLERIKKLESGGVSDEKTKLAIQRLEQSLASAESERDLARKDLDAQKALAESLQKAEKSHLETEQSLASQLAESTRRVEELASQVRRQLDTNASLRKRLADAAARGEADQEDLRNRVGTLQSRLADLERQVRDAQTAAEERVRRHEDELQAVREANSAQLTRITKDRDRAEADAKKARADRDKAERELREANRKLATATAASTPTSPFFGRDGLKSPRLRNADDSAAQVDMLRKRVAELEKAAFEADREMGEVVARMSSAQMEVARLQEERDTAARETRRLMRIIDEEKMKVFEERFRTLSSPGVK